MTIAKFLDFVEPPFQRKDRPRAGVVPYTFYNKKLHLCFGEDYRTKTIMDFAGGMERYDSSMIATAIREFNEETLGVFGSLTTEILQNATVVSQRFPAEYKGRKIIQDMVLIFVPVDEFPLSYTRAFQAKIQPKIQEAIRFKSDKNLEIRDFLWLTPELINQAIEGKYFFPMYSKVVEFFKLTPDLESILSPIPPKESDTPLEPTSVHTDSSLTMTTSPS